MRDLNPIYLPTLVQLLLLGARDQPVEISTVALAQKLGRSQQAASKHLLDLERAGLVERLRVGNRSAVRLTPKGVDALSALHSTLKGALETTPPTVELHGRVFMGLGEGGYYMSQRGYMRQFIHKLGFDPFPGTLNVRLDSAVDRRLRSELRQVPGILIEGFEDQKRTYGWVRCLPAVINEEARGVVLHAFERTHYNDSVIEVIAPIKIRETLRLEEGAPVRVRVYLSQPTSTPRSAPAAGGPPSASKS